MKFEPDKIQSISIESDVELMDSALSHNINREIEFSCEFEIEGDEVICPKCNETCYLPNGMLQLLIGRGPISCHNCGYSLR